MKPATKRFLRSLLVRPARDNTTHAGFLFYFALVIFILMLGFVMMRPKGHRTTLPAAVSVQKAQASKVETRRAGDAGASFAHVAPLMSHGDDPLKRSERVENIHPEQTAAAEPSAEMGFLDTVRMATAQSEPPHDEFVPPVQKKLMPRELQAAEVIDEHGAGISADGASSGDSARETGAGQPLRMDQPLQVQTGSLDIAALTVFKREADATRTAKKPSGFDTGNFLPKGQMIPVIFQTNVTTLDLSGMVEMQVAENVKFNGDVIRLPYGTKIYGSASTKNVADRIGISANTIVFTDGTELHIDGVALDSDAQAGVRGYYVPQPAAVQLFPYANAAAMGALQTLGQSQQVTSQSPLGLTTSSIQNPNSWRNALVNAGQQALQDEFNREQALLDQRYPAHVIVKKGTMAYVQLSSALDLDAGKIFQPQEEAKPADTAPTQSGFSPQPPAALRELLQKLLSSTPAG